MRPLKFLIGILLLPAGVFVTQVLFSLLSRIRPDSLSTLSPDTWGLLIGFVLWNILYLSLPRPVVSYVVAHELTHALWAILFGGRASGIRVGRKGGSVQVSKTNFVIALAPYFFPFYTMLVLLLYGAVSLFFDQQLYRPFWMGCVGLTWGFHATFTGIMLLQHQTDVEEHGRVFSYSLIYLLNLVGLCVWVVAVGDATLIDLAEAGQRHARDLQEIALKIADFRPWPAPNPGK